ncbi:2-succinyl-5-enolpyruvyl-6-hydroxy-3-cyclohexene-1-carboxylic-acid synthase [Nocardioides sp. CFH 31398]|uniref:2-succinyl-5-enolpyruvyl-6-hydroxy-3- cyclohexene-1-carboxylic-acid synthase n=1 Tax=Nocardioides sp. CFH 31398 TaxID=2919579 RepID=UPI001F05410F|nr:2-succinyl-5-enolpyruvyl-6-hydroxy-3-cyclohexene-1-carboxylic-acid synthase [Nocardioides sp. CFH 31398]MCH1865162.1 2-succinyl-5-enolpyruvyl-6-hydroxy-3-cyclohexene-1-carboxylic-acid synthase [Nocardioides sp. CFH 31398]
MTARGPSEPTTATDLARQVVGALLGAGVREVVLAPGSRNAPLAFAAHDAAAAGALRLHTRIDERTAAFLALGLTRHGRRAAVVCTSGTAAAHLHPAVLEASHAGTPLVAVTADRPAVVRGTGANQTTDQVDLYGDAADSLDLDHAPPGLVDRLLDAAHVGRPVHLNVQLAPPLVPADTWTDVPLPALTDEVPRRRRDRPPPDAVLGIGPRTVVVAGDDAGPPARQLAERAGWPLLAEPSSGSRTGAHALRCYRLLLAAGWADTVERVVVAGHPTLSRPVTDLLTRDGVEVVSLRARGRWPDRPFPVDAEHRTLDVEGPDDPAWLDAWRAADEATAAAVDARVAGERLNPWQVAGAVAAALPPGGLLVVGASNPVRDLDVMASGWGVGERRMVVANRGLAGIDGTVSTALGAALARDTSTRRLALLGDVTFLHDANGLVLGPDEPRAELTLVVVNDDGGSIFATLEQGAPTYAAAFERLFATPHGVDLGSLCAATRTPHRRVTTRAGLDAALATPAQGIEVVEAVVGRTDRREVDAALRSLAVGPA